MPTHTTAANRLRAARDDKRITRAELAAMVGIAESTVRAHESGQNTIKPEPAAAYAEALDVTPQWLLYGDDGGPRRSPSGAAVILHQMPDGKARLEINKVVPFDVALRVLALVEGIEP